MRVIEEGEVGEKQEGEVVEEEQEEMEKKVRGRG